MVGWDENERTKARSYVCRYVDLRKAQRRYVDWMARNLILLSPEVNRGDKQILKIFFLNLARKLGAEDESCLLCSFQIAERQYIEKGVIPWKVP